ncbi:hypothetical protein shim_00840 [Shimia sp. SK013]|uniref:hypothetical protein n=1 Tax=Shimia sp. SK013 TaxID=1389006 RepID=UPI0006B49162|nr:hypothetical protein [Shimia sp. SK013]KPA23476.1 hypothetical protein shim_00840 [Shimia sp. SK013]
MAGIENFFNDILLWIKANPFLSGALFFVASLIGIYLKTAVQTIAKQHTEKILNGKNHEEEVFDEPVGPLLENRTNEELRGLSSEELIDLYGAKNPPYRILIGETDWSFAATRELNPTGNGAIDKQEVFIKYHDEWFELEHHLNWLTADRLKALEAASKVEDLFNGDPFRIIDIQSDGDRSLINVGRCKYFDSLRTSFAMDFVLPSEGKSLREILHGSAGTFGPLSNSKLPNHMGLVVIIETLDGQIVVQKRSTKVQIRPGTLSASVSGTFEKNDLSTSSEPLRLVEAISGVVREMHGELGGQYSYSSDNFFFLGLMREFRRGGFPDFYFYYRSPLTFTEIEANSTHAEEIFEVESVLGFYLGSTQLLENYEEEKHNFDMRMNRLMHDIEGKANLTLSLGLALYYEMIIGQTRATSD